MRLPLSLGWLEMSITYAGCTTCGHLKNRHEGDELACGFPGCECEEYLKEDSHLCISCGSRIFGLAEYEQHKKLAWENGKCSK